MSSSAIMSSSSSSSSAAMISVRRAAFRLAQLILRAARHDLTLEVEVVRDKLEQRERARYSVDERDRVVAERCLQRGVLEELVEHDLGPCVALQLDLDAHSRAVGV